MLTALAVGSVGPVDRSIGRLAQYVIQVRGGLRIRLQKLESGPDISGEQNSHRRGAIFGNLNLYRHGAEQMTGIPITDAHAGKGLEPLIVIFDAQMFQGRFSIGYLVDGFNRRAPAASVALIKLTDLDFLDVA